MLKTKLHKAGFIFTSFMLMAAASGNRKVTVTAGPSEIIKIELPADSTGSHVFDTTGLCTCLLNSMQRRKKMHRGYSRTYWPRNLWRRICGTMACIMKRSERKALVFSMIDDIFDKYELPNELKYLAVVESKLDNHIVSSAGAAGLWQFMPQA